MHFLFVCLYVYKLLFSISSGVSVFYIIFYRNYHLTFVFFALKLTYTPPQGDGKWWKMDNATKQSITRRLASAAGHIKGIERMVSDDAYCIDVIKQIQAVQAALNKVSTMMLDNHLHTCVTTAIRGDNPDERERMLQEITGVFSVTNNK